MSMERKALLNALEMEMDRERKETIKHQAKLDILYKLFNTIEQKGKYFDMIKKQADTAEEIPVPKKVLEEIIYEFECLDGLKASNYYKSKYVNEKRNYNYTGLIKKIKDIH